MDGTPIAFVRDAMELDREVEAFRACREQLLREHRGAFALFVGAEFLGAFDTEDDAAAAGLKLRGNVPMLIKRIVEQEKPVMVPFVQKAGAGASTE